MLTERAPRQTGEGGFNTFLAPDSATARLFEEAARLMPGGTSRLHYYSAPYPVYARSGKGAYLTDVEGTERRVEYAEVKKAKIQIEFKKETP